MQHVHNRPWQEFRDILGWMQVKWNNASNVALIDLQVSDLSLDLMSYKIEAPSKSI
jgi:hypothetical protein